MGRVAIIGYNSVEMSEIIVDAWNQNKSIVMLDWRMPLDTVRELIEECCAEIVYIDSALWDKYKDLLRESCFVVVPFKSNIDDDRFLPQSIYLDFKPNYSDDEAAVIFSSGTTGMAKGVRLSHFAINKNADAISSYMKLSKDDVMYIVKSMNHSSTFVGELLLALKQKIPAIIGKSIVPPRYTLEKINILGATVLVINPTLLRLYVREMQKREMILGRMRDIYVCGALLSNELFHEAKKVFEGVKIHNMYGLSEAGPRVTCQTGLEWENSVGKPIKDVEIKIVDELGRDVREGGSGEVLVHTPSLFLGYVTGNTMKKSEYWYRTGDIGYLKKDGDLVILGRKDDVINIDAHNVVPSTIENIVAKTGIIEECCVLEVPKGIITCVISLKDGIKPYDAVRKVHEVCKEKLASYEMPKKLVVRDIPKNRNGKIDRRILAKEIEEDGCIN